MKIITFEQNVLLNMGYWKFTHKLSAGIEYVVFNKFFDNLSESMDIFVIRDLGDEVTFYQREDLTEKLLLFTAMGGYGDGLSLIQALNALQNKYPTAQVDLMVHLDTYLLVKQFGFKGDWVDYPISLDYLKRYDYFQTAESLYGTPGYYKNNVARMFCEMFSVPMELAHSKFRPAGIAMATRLGTSEKKRVAIQVDALTGDMRSYPDHSIKTLALLLSKSGLEVYLVGFHDNPSVFGSGPGIHNFVNRLSSIVDLAGLISQMDVIVAPDSVGGHLGGLLDIPTIVLFGVTGTDKMDQYPSVHGIQSELPCSPCYQLHKCPMEYERCMAMEHISVSPANMMYKIMLILGGI